MTRETYRRSLTELRSDVVAMGETVVERLEMARECLSTGDEALAREVVEGDDAVNEAYLELEHRCIELVALQQPVASDLRFVAASFKISTDLERIGDLATNLAQYALAADGEFAPAVGVDEISRDATALLERSLEAYAGEDVDACREIAAEDDEIDARCRRANQTVARSLIEDEVRGGEPRTVEELLDDASRVFLTVRDLERVADHAVNIAARTLYMVENDPELIY